MSRAEGANAPERDLRPAFGMVAGKYFLKKSSWAGSGTKLITYRLFHMHGDAFQWFYSEVPKNLTVVHTPSIDPGAKTFTVTADAGSFIALTTATANGPVILGTAKGTGSPVNITLAQSPGTNMLVTVTKQNYFRYSKSLSVVTSNQELPVGNFNLNCYPNPFNKSTTLAYSLDEAGNVTLSVYNMLSEEVAVIINNKVHAKGSHQVEFSSENLPAGMYSCVLKAGNKIVTKSVVITK